MRFAILGPLEVVVNGRLINIARPRWRSVLAYLLLNSNRFVSTGQLITALWGNDPPATASTQLHNAVSAIRRALRQAGADGVISTQQAGYAIHLSADSLDLAAFTQAVSTARELAQTDPPAAMAQLRTAVGLWRGEALEGINGVFVTGARVRLAEERLAAAERLIGLEIAQGNHTDVIAGLVGLVESHPLRESLTRLLMLALYRGGRKADALTAYAALRERITTDLGLEPGAELRQLHLEILQDDPAPSGIAVLSLVSARQLPPPDIAFTGRAAERGRLRDALTGAVPGAPARAKVVLLHGAGGAGKSTLAIQAAHDVAEEFPDGQLYLDCPLTAMEILRRCLRGLGQPEAAIPASESEAAALYRSLTADRRLLVFLDNADDLAQVQPVIPVSPQAAVIVTSRPPLTLLNPDLMLRVESMPPAEAVALLTRTAGRAISTDEPCLYDIAAYCDYLPLALSIAGARLACEPDLSASRLAAALSNRRNRLDWLELDGVGVRSSIRIGYDLVMSGVSRTDQVAVAAFRALGLLAVPSLDGGLIAAMIGEDSHATGSAALARLARAQLVRSTGDGRYHVHETVRLVAAECAEEMTSSGDRLSAVQRGLTYFLGCALRAAELLRLGRSSRIDQPRLAELAGMDLTGAGLSSAADVGPWLDRELPNLVAAAQIAASGASEYHAIWLAESLTRPLRKRGEFHRESALARNAVEAAERLRDEALLGRALLHLGRSELHLGRNAAAHAAASRSLDIAVASGNLRGQASALNDVGLIALARADDTLAQECFASCVRLGHGTADEAWINRIMLHNLGHIHIRLGDWHAAGLNLTESLRLRRETGDRATGTTLVLLGMVKCHLGELGEAVSYLAEGVSISQATGFRVDSARGLSTLAVAYLKQGKTADAATAARESLNEAIALGDPYAEATAHRLLAAALAGSNPRESRAHTMMAAAINSSPSNAPEDFAIESLLASLD
jgi:DNA-binding SARP family transcriptional activator/tetratricopeptide (TPR) repeat protein